MYAPGLVWGPPEGPLYELIRGPLFQKKRLAPQNGGFQELIRGPCKSWQEAQHNLAKKAPSLGGRLLTLRGAAK